jgi:hypothetical protein
LPAPAQAFEAREAPLYERMAAEAGAAREAARVAELKSQEAAAEARGWARAQAGAGAEGAAARACLDQAAADMDAAEGLLQEGQHAKHDLDEALQQQSSLHPAPFPSTKTGTAAAAPTTQGPSSCQGAAAEGGGPAAPAAEGGAQGEEEGEDPAALAEAAARLAAEAAELELEAREREGAQWRLVQAGENLEGEARGCVCVAIRAICCAPSAPA